jgi:hypothetical protein
MTPVDGGHAVFAGVKNGPWHRAITYRDLPGAKILTVHPTHKKADIYVGFFVGVSN